MMGFSLTFIVIIGLVLFALTKKKSSSVPGQFSRRTHFTILTVFIGFLFVCATIAELMEPFQTLEAPFTKVSAAIERERIDLEMDIMNGNEVDPSLILETRTHPVGNSLTIHRNHGEFDGPIVYVKHKQEGETTIEEIIYKPFLAVSDYDFSDALTVTKPTWTEDSVTFRPNSLIEVSIVSYYDAPLLNRLTRNGFQGDEGYSSVSRSPVIQLIVPENVEIIMPSGDEDVFFVDETNA